MRGHKKNSKQKSTQSGDHVMKNKTLVHYLFLFVIFLLIEFTNQTARSEPEVIHLSRGKRHLLNISPGQTVWANTREFITLNDLGNQIQITAKKIGTTELNIGQLQYQIEVIGKSTLLTYLKLNHLLKKMMGLKVEIANNEVLIKGELLRLSDLFLIASECNDDDQYKLKTKIDPQLKQKLILALNKKLFNQNLSPPDWSWSSSAIAQIPEKTKSLLTQYKKFLMPYGIEVQTHSNTMDLVPLIEIEIQILELKKKLFRRIGIGPPTSYQASVLSGNSQVSVSELLVNLNLLEQKGMGQVIATPKLICESGQKAEFLAGGQFPIKIANYHAQDVVWKKHGVILQIQPEADLKGKIRLQLTTEISIIDSSQTVDGIPGLNTNRVQSVFNLPHSQTIALSGLVRLDRGKSHEGWPHLSGLPIIGKLFSSQDFINQKTELVIFVTPKIIHLNQYEAPQKPFELESTL